MKYVEEKSSKQKFVYDLIYPALLGAMLYDLIPYKDEAYIIKLSLAIFYLFDYCHLYLFMEKHFTQKQRDSFVYVAFDFIVSILLFVAFKYAHKTWMIYLIAIIPTCFLIYSLQIKYRVAFYWTYLLIGFLGVLTLKIFGDKTKSDLDLVLLYTISMTAIYCVYVIVTPFIKIKQNDT